MSAPERTLVTVVTHPPGAQRVPVIGLDAGECVYEPCVCRECLDEGYMEHCVCGMGRDAHDPS